MVTVSTLCRMPMGGGRGVTMSALCWFYAKGSHICCFLMFVSMFVLFFLWVLCLTTDTHISLILGNSFRFIFVYSLRAFWRCRVFFSQERPGSNPGRFWCRGPALALASMVTLFCLPMSVFARPTDLWDGKKKKKS